MEKAKGLLEIHIAVFLFGLAGVFGKLLSLPPTIIVLGRVFFATLFLLILIRILKEKIKLNDKKDYLLLSCLGVILAIHWVTFFHSVQISTVAIGLLTFSTFPIFVTFLEPYFFKEKLTISNFVLAMIAFFGIVLIIPKFDVSNNIAQGVFWGVISGFTFAMLSVLNKKYVKQYSSVVIAFYQDAVATIVLVPFLLIETLIISARDFWLLVLLGVLLTGVSHSLFIKGLSHVKAHTASIVANLEAVYGILLAIIVVNEIPSLRVVVGGVIILSTAFYVTYRSRSQVEVPQ